MQHNYRAVHILQITLFHNILLGFYNTMQLILLADTFVSWSQFQHLINSSLVRFYQSLKTRAWIWLVCTGFVEP